MNALYRWDHGNKTVRKQVLEEFIKNFSNSSAMELDVGLSYSSSLFLTRILTYLRLSYSSSDSVALQIQAIRIFLVSVGGIHYVVEFAEMDGMIAVVKVMQDQSLTEEDLLECISLVKLMVSFGKTFKEIVVKQCDGLQSLIDCLSNTTSIKGFNECKSTLMQLISKENVATISSCLFKCIANADSFNVTVPQYLPSNEKIMSSLSSIYQLITLYSCPLVSSNILLLIDCFKYDFNIQYKATEILKIYCKEHAQNVLFELVKLLEHRTDCFLEASMSLCACLVHI